MVVSGSCGGSKVTFAYGMHSVSSQATSSPGAFGQFSSPSQRCTSQIRVLRSGQTIWVSALQPTGCGRGEGRMLASGQLDSSESSSSPGQSLLPLQTSDFGMQEPLPTQRCSLNSHSKNRG